MANLYIIGNGGLSREFTTYIDNYYFEKYSSFKKQYLVTIDNILFKTDLTSSFREPFNISSIDVTKDIAIVAIGRLKVRNSIINIFKKHFNKKHLQLLFPNFYFCNDVPFNYSNIGHGNVFCPKCVITEPKIFIKDFNLFNYGCNISHDNIIGSYNSVCPNLTLLGRSTIGNNNFIGSNVTILPDLSVGDNNSITAGITLRNSISNNRKVRLKVEDVSIF